MARDREQMGLLRRTSGGMSACASHTRAGLVDPALEQHRWMIEEYRVSLFAQDLGTSVPVSPKRLDAQWEQVRP